MPCGTVTQTHTYTTVSNRYSCKQLALRLIFAMAEVTEKKAWVVFEEKRKKEKRRRNKSYVSKKTLENHLELLIFGILFTYALNCKYV